jgi:hypothetical protein
MPSASYWGDFSDRNQPTLNTVQDYINDARTLLQDVVPNYRYDDPSLLVALNITLAETKRIRADLFVFNLNVFGQAQAFTTVDDTYVDIPVPFRLAILHGVCAHAMERDQEDYADSRSAAFMNMFNQGLLGRNLGPIMGGAGPGR